MPSRDAAPAHKTALNKLSYPDWSRKFSRHPKEPPVFNQRWARLSLRRRGATLATNISVAPHSHGPLVGDERSRNGAPSNSHGYGKQTFSTRFA
jgi:hypothetical protein